MLILRYNPQSSAVAESGKARVQHSVSDLAPRVVLALYRISLTPKQTCRVDGLFILNRLTFLIYGFTYLSGTSSGTVERSVFSISAFIAPRESLAPTWKFTAMLYNIFGTSNQWVSFMSQPKYTRKGYFSIYML